MRPGQVTSDEQAFNQILARLQSEVGTFLKLIQEAKAANRPDIYPNTAPFWASPAPAAFPAAGAGTTPRTPDRRRPPARPRPHRSPARAARRSRTCTSRAYRHG